MWCNPPNTRLLWYRCPQTEGNCILHHPHKPHSSFASWMEVWNIYAITLLSTKPQRTLVLFGYRRIITSAILQTTLTSWMTYDIKFRTLVAIYPSLRWDTQFSDPWMECITMPRLSLDRWPCPHYNSTNHFLERSAWHTLNSTCYTRCWITIPSPY